MYKYSENHPFKYLFSLFPVKRNAIFLTFHNFTERDLIWFGKFVKRYKNRIKSIDEFDYNNLNENDIFLSFDDGFHSNYIVAKNILDKHHIKGLFFLTNNFLNLVPLESLNFAKKKLFPDSKIKNISDIQSMNNNHIFYLIKNGHEIGCHTLNHPKLKSLNYPQQLKEIIESKIFLEKNFKIKINKFAYPFGNTKYINRDSIKIIENNFKYSFTNIRGSIKMSPSNQLILRQNIVPGMPFWLTDAIIDSKINFLYNRERSRLKLLTFKKYL